MFTHSLKLTDGKCRDRFRTPIKRQETELFAKKFEGFNLVNTFAEISASGV